MYPNSAFFRRKGAIGVGGGGGGGERTSGLFVKSFPAGFRKKTTQEHLFKSHKRSAREVWVDSDIPENFSRNGGYVVLARSHSIVLYRDTLFMSFIWQLSQFHFSINLIPVNSYDVSLVGMLVQ